MLFLVSDERRQSKPYCQPVQYKPYHSVKDQYVRDMALKIREEMKALEMKPVGMQIQLSLLVLFFGLAYKYLEGKFIFPSHFYTGFVSDGEFNSLRTQGEHRPVHLWQLIHDAKESVSRQSQQTLFKRMVKIGGVFIV